MRESTVETYFKRRVKEAGGLERKWVSPGVRGVPDRVAIFSGGRISFVELKATYETLRESQVREHARLAAMGCIVHVLDSKEAVDEFIKWRTA